MKSISQIPKQTLIKTSEKNQLNDEFTQTEKTNSKKRRWKFNANFLCVFLIGLNKRL